MKEFKFACPHCAQHIQVAENLAGRQVQCPNCNRLIRVPPPPSKADQTKGTVESGRTWDTFIPPSTKK